MKTIKVKVTLGHIALGQRRKEELCPIALALKDAGINKVAVGQTVMRIEDQLIKPQLPECAEFVKRFDNGDPVSPFEFRVSIPD